MSALFKITNFKKEDYYVIADSMNKALNKYKAYNSTRALYVTHICFIDDIIGLEDVNNLH